MLRNVDNGEAGPVGLVGRWFLDGSRQGFVRESIGERYYIAQLFSWVDGSPTNEVVIAIETVTGPEWKWFSDQETWLEAGARQAAAPQSPRGWRRQAAVADDQDPAATAAAPGSPLPGKPIIPAPPTQRGLSEEELRLFDALDAVEEPPSPPHGRHAALLKTASVAGLSDYESEYPINFLLERTTTSDTSEPASIPGLWVAFLNWCRHVPGKEFPRCSFDQFLSLATPGPGHPAPVLLPDTDAEQSEWLERVIEEGDRREARRKRFTDKEAETPHQFLGDCEFGDEFYAAGDTLWRAYRAWCAEFQKQPGPQEKFFDYVACFSPAGRTLKETYEAPGRPIFLGLRLLPRAVLRLGVLRG